MVVGPAYSGHWDKTQGAGATGKLELPYSPPTFIAHKARS